MYNGILNCPLLSVIPSIGNPESITNLTLSPSIGLFALSYTNPDIGTVEFTKPSNSTISIRVL